MRQMGKTDISLENDLSLKANLNTCSFSYLYEFPSSALWLEEILLKMDFHSKNGSHQPSRHSLFFEWK